MTSDYSNYLSAKHRIERAESKHDLYKAEAGITRVYDAGQLTVSEVARLDAYVLKRWGQLGIDGEARIISEYRAARAIDA